jgi:hypothetical protein
MNIEELVQASLDDVAAQTAPIDDLVPTVLHHGHRRRRVRRTASVAMSVVGVGTVIGAAVVAANHTGHPAPRVAHQATEPTAPPTTPWWESWPAGRQYGPLDKHFVDAATPNDSKVYASGTMPDGTDFAVYLDSRTGHTPQWIQGWNGAPDFGDSSTAGPSATWMTWTTPDLATHESADGSTNRQWLIVVGRPGTTSIDYSANGTTWQPMNLEQGIGVIHLLDGFPPASAQVRLADDSGVYATGTPAGAGAG